MSTPIVLRVQPARAQMQVCSEPQIVYLLLTAKTVVTARDPLPLNVCLVLDRSLSMRGERLFQVKQAARRVVDQLTPRDAFSLVTFNDRGEVVVGAQLVKEPEWIERAIAGIEASGGTELAQGLALGLSEIERPRIAGIHRLILLTDGCTYGDEHTCVALAHRAQGRGIGITALGIGTEWNEDLLQSMTAGLNSRTLYLQSTKEITDVFAAEIERLHRTIAQNVELLIQTHAHTKVHACHRVQPFIAPLSARDLGHGRWHMSLGEWVGGEDQHLLIELLVPPVSAGTHPVARIDMRCAAGTSVPSGTTMLVQLPAASSAAPPIDPDVQSALERVVAYRLQNQAWQAVAEGRIEEATKRLQVAGTHLLHAGETALAQTIHIEATRLLHNQATSADARKRIKLGTRGLLAGQPLGAEHTASSVV